MALFFGLLGADGGASLRRLLRDDQPAKQLAGMFQMARALTADQLWQLVARRTHYRARFLAQLDAGHYDAIICPPCPLPALIHGTSSSLGTAGSYAVLYNLLGMPAGVVPATRVRPGEESDRPESQERSGQAAKQVERNSAGLPVGVQVVARHFREDIALAIMSALEDHFRRQPDYPGRPEI
jgi:fatty acid amide hydrolase